MPLWSDLFEGYDKNKPFKPKRPCPPSPQSPDRSGNGSSSVPSVLTPPVLQSNVRRSVSHDTIRSISSGAGGVKKSSSLHTPSHDDTLATIETTMRVNRQKKSSTPKTPQTPQPPAILIERIESEDSEPIIMEPLEETSYDPLEESSNIRGPISQESDTEENVGLKIDAIMDQSAEYKLSECVTVLERSSFNEEFHGHVNEELLVKSEEGPHTSHTSHSQTAPDVLHSSKHDHGITDEHEDQEQKDDSNPWMVAQVSYLLLL